jgi:hypothetical protein
MNDRILNKPKYIEDVRYFYKPILEGRFLSLNTETMNDEESLHSLPYRLTDCNKSFCFDYNFCIWFTIGLSRELEFVSTLYQGTNIFCPLRTKISTNEHRVRFNFIPLLQI